MWFRAGREEDVVHKHIIRTGPLQDGKASCSELSLCGSQSAACLSPLFGQKQEQPGGERQGGFQVSEWEPQTYSCPERYAESAFICALMFLSCMVILFPHCRSKATFSTFVFCLFQSCIIICNNTLVTGPVSPFLCYLWNIAFAVSKGLMQYLIRVQEAVFAVLNSGPHASERSKFNKCRWCWLSKLRSYLYSHMF